MKHMLNALAFYATYPGWHSFDTKDRATVLAVRSLERQGFLEVNNYNQARIISEVNHEQ